MKKTFILLLGLVVAASTFAQNPEREKKTPQERADLITNNLQEKLSLDEGQVTTVLQANLSAAEAIDALRAQANPEESDRSARRALAKEARSINDQRMDAIREVLSDDQTKLLDELITEYRQKAKERAGRRRANFWSSLSTE
ncbi:MAG: hypothetical protein AAGA85_07600 [Bacteroidota bacterium]